MHLAKTQKRRADECTDISPTDKLPSGPLWEPEGALFNQNP